jgi:CheY-like chemotaxis protein
VAHQLSLLRGNTIDDPRASLVNRAAVGEPPVETPELSVLVAESSAFMRSLNAILLSGDFHVVDVASTGVEAQQLLDDHHPDVIVADRDLNITDGLELAEDVKSTTPDVGIVLVCASGSALEAETDDHVDQVVTRPYQLGGLTEAVVRAASLE